MARTIALPILSPISRAGGSMVLYFLLTVIVFDCILDETRISIAPPPFFCHCDVNNTLVLETENVDMRHLFLSH